MIQALSEIKIHTPVKKEIKDSVIKDIEKTAKEIIVFNHKNKILKNWKIGRYDKNIEGTYIMAKNNENPFVVNIPGLENNLHNRYNINTLYWINPELFSYQPHEIKELSIKNTFNTNKSFKFKN